MTDKVQKIREEVERLKRWNDNVRESTRHMTLQEEDFNRGKHSSYLEILNFIDSMQEEPVSEDLEEAIKVASEKERMHKAESESPFFMPADFASGFKDGAKWQKENLWKPADGEDLPEIDREVVVLTQPYSNDEHLRVVFAHRPNPEGWDAKSIITEKVERYIPETYDKGGWNIPDVKWWLDVELPKEIEL